jgi:hypothetical protein
MSTAAVAAKLASLQLDGFEKRKQFGKLGKKVKIMTNMFEITRLPQTVIMQYVSHLPFPFPLLLFVVFCLRWLTSYRFDVNITPDVPPILNRYVFPSPSHSPFPLLSLLHNLSSDGMRNRLR